MTQQNEYLELIKELQNDITDIVKELINEEVVPLLKERQKIEKSIGDKAIKELYELEKEAM